MAKTIADTSVLVAFFDKNDSYNKWAIQQFRDLPKPFISCEAVVTETCFLLQHIHQGEQTFLSFIETGIIEIDFSFSNEISEIKNLMKKYGDVPMSFADACLARMSELHQHSSIFTLDSDFHIYRQFGKKEIPLIIPVEI